MKIQIWIKKEEAISGNITKYYTTEPVTNLKDPDKYRTEYVQVSITQDMFAELEDRAVPRYKLMNNEPKDDEWYVNQYNRNRLHSDQIDNKSQIESSNKE
jgi:hypothetical protein